MRMIWFVCENGHRWKEKEADGVGDWDEYGFCPTCDEEGEEGEQPPQTTKFTEKQELVDY